MILEVIALIIVTAWFAWIGKDWLFKNLSYKELKKVCGSIHPLDYIYHYKKKLELKDIECSCYKEEIHRLKQHIRENRVYRKVFRK
jgi:hypothetical protein